MIIRPATPADAAMPADLYLRARHASSEMGTIPPLVHADDEVREWVGQVVIPTRACWLAERSPDAAIVGMLVLEEDWIDQLYVDPDLTGMGIGSELMVVAKRERRDGLRLWAFVSNEGAQRFYVRHGFRELQRTDGSRNEEAAPDILYAWCGA